MEEIKITIPGGWDDVTIEQYQNMDWTNLPKTISSLWRIDEYTATHMDMNVLDLFAHLNFVTTEPVPVFKTELYDCKFVDIDDLSAGDLESIEKLCKNFKTNAHLIAAWMYRNGMTFETRSEMLRDVMKVDELYGACVHIGLVAGILLVPDEISGMMTTITQMSGDPEGFELASEVASKIKEAEHGS